MEALLSESTLKLKTFRRADTLGATPFGALIANCQPNATLIPYYGEYESNRFLHRVSSGTHRVAVANKVLKPRVLLVVLWHT